MRSTKKFEASIRYVACIFLTTVVVVSEAVADDFPQSYINNQLNEARRTILVDVAKVKVGEALSLQYVGRPLFLYRRTAADIQSIELASGSTFEDSQNLNIRASIRSEYGSSSSAVWARLLLLSQPIALISRFRSVNREWAILGGWSPSTGCKLVLNEPTKIIKPGVVFSDPCSGQQFDSAGKLFSTESRAGDDRRFAKFNIAIPPYRIDKNGKIIIGPSVDDAIPELNFSHEELYRDSDPTMRLLTAARYDDLEAVRAALKDGAKADYYKQGVGSPIDAAVVGSSMAIIKLLVANGAKKTPNTLNAAKFLGRNDVVDFIQTLPN
jgi:hypothetical protein